MASAAEILAAFRELSNAKQLERAELYGLLQDGILAALAKKYGPTVQAEVDISMAVNSIDKCSDDTVGKGALKYSNLAKDAQAMANLANTAEQVVELIPF